MSYGEKIREYLKEANGANTHTGKVVAFSGLLKAVFGVSGLEIVPNVEKYIKSGEIRTLKGRMDLHLGQIIIAVSEIQWVAMGKTTLQCHKKNPLHPNGTRN